MRVNINMDEELVKKIDEIANKMYVSRSAYIAFAVSQKIQQDKMLESMPDVLEVARQAIKYEQSKSVNTALSEEGEGGEA